MFYFKQNVFVSIAMGFSIKKPITYLLRMGFC